MKDILTEIEDLSLNEILDEFLSVTDGDWDVPMYQADKPIDESMYDELDWD